MQVDFIQIQKTALHQIGKKFNEYFKYKNKTYLIIYKY